MKKKRKQTQNKNSIKSRFLSIPFGRGQSYKCIIFCIIFVKIVQFLCFLRSNRILLYFSRLQMFEGERINSFITHEKTWEQMDKNERLQYSNNVKAKAAVMLIQTTQFVQSKNYEKAKQLLVQIAESCSRVGEPDEQVLKWIQISCSYLAMLHRNSQHKKLKSNHAIQKKRFNTHQNFVVLKYNKFSGQFEPDEYEESYVTQDVLKYVSRINMILFGCQNVENNHSLYIMFTSYWIPFTLAFALLIMAFIFLASQKIFDKSNEQMSENFQIPALVIGGLLILPLFMIFFKALEQKDNTFFQKKLGQEIKRINQDCNVRNNKLQFMMPHGGQINVKIGRPDFHDQDDRGKDQVIQTPQEEFMKTIKGFTREMSKISGASLGQLRT